MPPPVLPDATKPFGPHTTPHTTPHTLGTTAAAARVAYVPASRARVEPGDTAMGVMTALSHAAAADVAKGGADGTLAGSMLPGQEELEECAEAWAAQRAARALEEAQEGGLQRTVSLLAGRPTVDTYVESQRAEVDRLREKREGRVGGNRFFSSAKTFGAKSEVPRPSDGGCGGDAAVSGATHTVASPRGSGALRPRRLSLGKMLSGGSLLSRK